MAQIVSFVLLVVLLWLPPPVVPQFGAATRELPTKPGRDECVYSFTISGAQVRHLCDQEAELGPLVQQMKVESDAIKAENAELKASIAKLRADYEGMVKSVSKIEVETAGWRNVVSWPNVEYILKPDNTTLITVDSPAYTDCWAAYQAGHRKPGIYKIKPKDSLLPFYAFCDGAGWMIFQRRFDGKTSFYRTWDEYSRGFGDLVGEFYLGNEAIHQVTQQGPYELRAELVGWNGKIYHSNYDDFSLGGELAEYAIHVGNLSKGNYVSVLTELDGQAFTAKDRDNDNWYSSNCADYYRGGWWLTNCGFDLHRSWCEGAGCMSWGRKVVKKSQLKIRPMSASGRAPESPVRELEPPPGPVNPFAATDPPTDEYFYDYGDEYDDVL